MAFKRVPRFKTTPKSRDVETGLPINGDGSLVKPEFMKIKKRKTTKKEKMVMCKNMYKAGWSKNVLQGWFGIKNDTIYRWAKIPTPEALKLFEEKFKLAMADFDYKATFQIKSRILDLIPEEYNIDKLVKAGEFFAKHQEPKANNQNNTQVNVYSDLVNKYKKDSQ